MILLGSPNFATAQIACSDDCRAILALNSNSLQRAPSLTSNDLINEITIIRDRSVASNSYDVRWDGISTISKIITGKAAIFEFGSLAIGDIRESNERDTRLAEAAEKAAQKLAGQPSTDEQLQEIVKLSQPADSWFEDTSLRAMRKIELIAENSQSTEIKRFAVLILEQQSNKSFPVGKADVARSILRKLQNSQP